MNIIEGVSIFISAIAALFAGFAGWKGKQAIDHATASKAEAETAKIDAQVESVYIENAKRLVVLMEDRLAGMEKEFKALQRTLAHHQEELDRAIRQETATQQRLLLVQGRVTALEIYIRRHGLEVPNGTGYDD